MVNSSFVLNPFLSVDFIVLEVETSLHDPDAL